MRAVEAKAEKSLPFANSRPDLRRHAVERLLPALFPLWVLAAKLIIHLFDDQHYFNNLVCDKHYGNRPYTLLHGEQILATAPLRMDVNTHFHVPML